MYKRYFYVKITGGKPVEGLCPYLHGNAQLKNIYIRFAIYILMSTYLFINLHALKLRGACWPTTVHHAIIHYI